MTDLVKPGDRFRVFIAAPEDVQAERVVVEELVRALDQTYGFRQPIEMISWRHEALDANAHFQTGLSKPHDADVVVVLLWTRLGRPLPFSEFPGPISGKVVTGTEWEFEDALVSLRTRQRPRLMVYRKQAPPVLDLTKAAVRKEQLEQLNQLEAFWSSWFESDQDQIAKAAHYTFTTGQEFKTLIGTHLRKVIEQRLEQTRSQDELSLTSSAGSWDDNQSPFLGLRSFELEQAALFFGRTRVRAELVAQLDRRIDSGNSFVLVLGASGSGKSSLVKAGLLWDLHQGTMSRFGFCGHAIMRPGGGESPLSALAEALCASSALPTLAPAGQWLEALRVAPESVIAPIVAGVKNAARITTGHENSARLVVVVDQLEELFTRPGLTPADRDRFVAALETLASSGWVSVVGALRSDFFNQLENLPRLARLASGDGQYLLLPPDAGDLDQIIRGPAQAAGLTFEVDPASHERLDETIRKVALRDAAVLPLLSVLLDRLWRLRRGRELSCLQYRELGGLEGALGQWAEEVFAALAPPVQVALPGVLRALVANRGDGAAASGPARLDRFPENGAHRRLIDAFLEQRLLVAEKDDGGSAQVRVSHEALLSHWPRAAEQIEKDLADQQLLSRLRREAEWWRQAEEPEHAIHLLRSGLQLSQAEDLLARWSDDPFNEDDILSYIDASVAHDADRTRKRLALVLLLMTLVLLLAIAGIGAWFGWSGRTAAERSAAMAEQNAFAAERSAAEAKRSQDVAEEEKLRAIEQERQAKIVLTAAQLNQSRFLNERAIAAQKGGNYIVAVLAVLSGLPYVLRAETRPLYPPMFGILAGALSKDRLQSISDGTSNGYGKQVISQDGRYYATISADYSARIWDTASEKRISTLAGHAGSINSIQFISDGTRVVTASNDYTARVWDVVSGKCLITIFGHTGQVMFAQFSPDGSKIVTTSFDKTARIWDATSGKHINTLRGHSKLVSIAQFSLDGRRVVTGAWDKTARIWDVASGRQVKTLVGHKDSVISANFSPDGTRIATGSSDATVRIWDSGNGNTVAVLPGHKDQVAFVKFSSDGTRIISTSSDGEIREWSVIDQLPTLITPVQMTANSISLVSPDGTRKIAATGRKVLIIDTTTGKVLFSLAAHTDRVNFVQFSRDGKLLVTVSDDKTARIWDINTGLSLVTLAGGNGTITSAQFSTDGTRIVTGSTDNTVRIWEIANGKPILSLIGHTNGIQTAQFNLDGTLVLTTSLDKTIRLWDVAFGVTIAILDGAFDDAQFGPDGRTIITVTGDTARAWPIPVRSATELLAASRMRVPRSLTEDEKKELFLDQEQEDDPVFGTLKPSGDAGEHQRLAERFEQNKSGKSDLSQALYHHALAARLYTLKGDMQKAGIETARRATLARKVSPAEAAAVWQRLWDDASGKGMRVSDR